MPNFKYSEQNMKDVVAKVNKYRQDGMNLPDACAKAKVELSKYNYFKARLEGKSWANNDRGKGAEVSQAVLRRNRFPTEFVPPAPQQEQRQVTVASPANREQMIALIGHPDDVNRALETIMKKGG